MPQRRTGARDESAFLGNSVIQLKRAISEPFLLFFTPSSVYLSTYSGSSPIALFLVAVSRLAIYVQVPVTSL